MKHTPGPWCVNLDGAKEAGDPNGYRPIGGCGCCGSPWANGASDEICDADARLIAASPELLQSLQDILKELSESDEEGLFEHSEIIKAARAVVRKATGE